MAGAEADEAPRRALPLISSKLQPPVPRRHVPREWLLRRCAGDRRTLTLVRAPAGWGKSTLLAQWCLSGAETRPFAWLALDRGDNDPTRFWTYLVEALRTRSPAIGVRTLATLQAPRIDVIRDVLPELCAELEALPHDLVLVLDDYHLVTNPRIDESLAAFVTHLPGTVQLVVASRSEPPLALARLRVQGQLLEIGAPELTFSEEEAALLLNDLHGLGLDRASVARLRERTEGWAAGLYLAALTLHGRADPQAFIRQFAGDDRHVVDYLSAEVLAGQPEELRLFLLRTSLTDRLCAPLCDVLTGRRDSAGVLRELESSNFFVVPLDTRRRWYRYHHLFGELLRQELHLVAPGEEAHLHRRAASWFRAAGLGAEAIQHATAAGDVEDATELILEHWIDARDRARLETLLAWLDALPPAAVVADPRLCLVRATTLQEVGRVEEAEQWLDAAARDGTTRDGGAGPRAGPGSLATGVAAGRAINRYFLGDAAGVRAIADPALGDADHGSGYWESALLTTLGTALFVGGDLRTAIAVMSRAVAAGERSGHALALVHALGWLAVLRFEADEPDHGEQVLHDLDALLGKHPGLGVYYGGAFAHLARGLLHRHRGAFEHAEEELTRGVELARRGGSRLEEAYGLAVHADARVEQGDREGALDLLDQVRTVLAACRDPGALRRRVTRVEQALGAPGRTPTSAVRRPALVAGSTGPGPYVEELSGRELAVLRLLPGDLTQREISRELYVSFNTVKSHVRSIFRKLGVSTRPEAVRRARELGLL